MFDAHPGTWALLALLLLFPSAAAATPTAGCMSPTSCLCGFGYSQRVVVQAKVVALQGEGAVVAIEAIDNPAGLPTALAEGATATLAYAGDYVVGDRFLGAGDTTNIQATVRIDADERVTCKYDPTFRPTVAEARAIMSAENCYAAMLAHSFKSTACVGGGGGGTGRTADDVGCAAGRGGGWGWLVLLACGAVTLLWRRSARMHGGG